MRLLCGLAIALWLSFPAAGMASRQQEPAGSANVADQAPGEPAPAASPPAENPASAQAAPDITPAVERKTAESVEKKQTGATKKRRKHTPATPGTPRKIVVREGGASQPAEQIVPGMTPAEAARQRQNAEQWLGSTDAQLKQLPERKLNPQQLETVGQIRNYMDGARAALKEGDVRRASTLAEKAHMLSDDLLHH